MLMADPYVLRAALDISRQAFWSCVFGRLAVRASQRCSVEGDEAFLHRFN